MGSLLHPRQSPFKMLSSVMTTVLTMFITTTVAQVTISSGSTLVSYPNGALVPEYTHEVAAARLQHLQELQALQGQDGRGLDLLDLLLIGLLNVNRTVSKSTDSHMFEYVKDLYPRP